MPPKQGASRIPDVDEITAENRFEIALMGDSFDRIKEKSRAEFFRLQATLILDYEANISPSVLALPPYNPRYIFVMIRSSARMPARELNNMAMGTDDDGDEWNGRMKTIQKKIDNQGRDAHRSQTRHKNEIENLKSEVKDLAQKSIQKNKLLDAKINDLMDKIDDLTAITLDMHEAMKHRPANDTGRYDV